jgi:hypothetical protein
MRRLLAPLVVAAVPLIAAACTAPDKGALILAVSTDMQTPKDIDVVSVYIETGGVVKYDFLGTVQDGSVSLPSTLAIVEPDDPNAKVRIRVTVFKTQPDGTAQAKVMRDVVTTIPHQRTGLLRMPLNFLDDGSVSGTLPASFIPNPQNPTAPPAGDSMYGPTDPVTTDPGYLKPTNPMCDFDTTGKTSINGVCQDATIDSTNTPDYTDDLVFGQGGTPGSPVCFSVSNCLAQAAPMQMQGITMAPDGTCSFPLTPSQSGNNWNCALATTDRTGECVGPNGGPPCLVPLESDPGEGFTITPGVQVSMVAGVCNKIMNGATLYIDKASCATKVEAAPVCTPVGMLNGMPDAGAPKGDAATFADATTSDGGAPPQDATTTTDSGGHDGAAGGDASVTCSQVGLPCSSPSQCCSGTCSGNLCTMGGACLQPGQICSTPSQCCSGACPAGTCSAPPADASAGGG